MTCLAILVNYHCIDLILAAVASIATDPECDWIHVVDNSEDAAEAALLRDKLPPKARLIVSPRNIGFGQACNLALKGMRPDAVLLLNPDAKLRPGALRHLKASLKAHKHAAAVGPRVYWDEDEKFLMPPSTYPSKLGFLTELLGRRWPWIEQFRAANFRSKSVIYWTRKQAVRVSALSGGHVLLRFNALIDVNGLFDPQFFMYWEDTDLMRRLHDKNWQLLMEPQAKAVHAYEHADGKDRLLADGWVAYQNRYFSHVFWQHLIRFCVCFSPPEVLHFKRIEPNAHADVCIEMPERLNCAWLMEISPSKEFIPSIGYFGHGAQALIPGHLAMRLRGRDYYVRVRNLQSPTQSTSLYRFCNR